MNSLKVAKLASTRSLDTLPIKGTIDGHGFRDLEMEQHVLEMSQKFGIGAQETAIETGNDAPWRGSLITRTS